MEERKSEERKSPRDLARLFHREVNPEEQALLDRLLDKLEVLDVDIFYYPFAGEFVHPEILSEMMEVYPILKEWHDKFGVKSVEKVQEVV
jgi:hypothetical protein